MPNNEEYNSSYTGLQIDAAIGDALEMYGLYSAVESNVINAEDITISDNGDIVIPSHAVGRDFFVVNSIDGDKIAVKNQNGTWTLIEATDAENITIDANGNIIISSESDSSLPAVTSEDEGKVLTVNSSGEWVAANLPYEDGDDIQY